MFFKEKIYLIAGSGTDVGKTYFLEKICIKLLKNGYKIDAIKPIISGFEASDLKSDSAKILKALNLEITQKNFDLVSPWRFKEPLSPNIAAKNFGKKINFLEVTNFCKARISQARQENSFLFIETAGGIMTPINDEKTFIDLADELKIPVLFISRNYLGIISQTLCAIEVMKSRNIKVETIFFNKFNDSSEAEAVANSIKNFSKIDTIFFDVFLD